MRPQRTWTGAAVVMAIVGLMGGCADVPPDPYMSAPPLWDTAPAPMPVVYVTEEAPMVQPAPVFIDAGPPPMLVEVVPPRPSYDAVWIGGYWGWRSQWVWCTGRWAPPPRPGYVWMQPYYENRGGVVVFVSGFWRAPHVAFAPPPPQLRMPVWPARGGGMPHRGPSGVFPPPRPYQGQAPMSSQVEPPPAPGWRPGVSRPPMTAPPPPPAWQQALPPGEVKRPPGLRPPRWDNVAPAQPPVPDERRSGRRWGGNPGSAGGAGGGGVQGMARPAAPMPVPSESRAPAEVRRVAPPPPAVTARDGAQPREAGGDRGGRGAAERHPWGARKKDDQ